MEVKERQIFIIDFEVLSKAKFWMCCIQDVKTGSKITVVNNSDQLKKIYSKFKNAIWVGYNIKGFDQWILKSIVADLNPFILSDAIISGNRQPWSIYPELNKTFLNFFEIGSRLRSLKELELFMGESIEESSVSFDLKTYPTKEEVEILTKYCWHDVTMTLKVFEKLRREFDSRAFLIDYFNLDDSLFKKTNAQFSAYLLGAKRPDFPRNDEFDFRIINNIHLDKYKFVLDWYKAEENKTYDKSLSTTVYDCPAEFGWGGFHSARKKYKGEGFFVNSDVKSYHPSNMIVNNFLSRNVADPKKYVDIRDTRLKLKEEKNPWEKSFKDVLNITYGGSKDPNNDLYDPQMANAVCVNGQLMLLDLIEKVEERFKESVTFVQGNTDGVMFKLENKKDLNDYLEICNTWSNKTGMELEHDYITKVVQKDVNNYLIVMEDGKVKRKGAYVKELSDLDNDLPIVNKAIVENILNGVSIRETIEKADNLIDFQKAIKITNKYDYAMHNGKVIDLKILRVFASKDIKDGAVTKVKNNSQEKIGNTPNKAFIENGNITNKKVPEKLDKEWYISIAEKRYEEFVPNSQYEYSLFDLL